MIKKYILGFIVAIVFIIVLILCLSTIENGKKKIKYEYYTLEGIKGTSNECVETEETYKCKIHGELVEVNQYSIMEEE